MKKGNPFISRESDWESVMNCESMKSVRRNILEKKWPSECAKCRLEHESGAVSLNVIRNYCLAEGSETGKPSKLF